jgi:hypothetical protein
MKYGLKLPCAECPFRKDSIRGYLGPDTGNPSAFVNPAAGRVEIQKGVFVGCEPSDLACHMDIDREMAANGGKKPDPDHLQHCAGALHFLRLDCKMPHDREKCDAMDRVAANNKAIPMLRNVGECDGSGDGSGDGKNQAAHFIRRSLCPMNAIAHCHHSNK